MRESDYHRLCRIRVQRELTAEERARLELIIGQHPEFQEDWELEQLLNTAWAADPVSRVSSNFTARVRQSIDASAGEFTGAAPGNRLGNWIRRIAKPAVAMLVIGGLAFAGWEHHQRERDFRLKSLAAVAVVVELPDVKVLQDLEIIERLAAIPVEPDTELLLALE